MAAAADCAQGAGWVVAAGVGVGVRAWAPEKLEHQSWDRLGPRLHVPSEGGLPARQAAHRAARRAARVDRLRPDHRRRDPRMPRPGRSSTDPARDRRSTRTRTGDSFPTRASRARTSRTRTTRWRCRRRSSRTSRRRSDCCCTAATGESLAATCRGLSAHGSRRSDQKAFSSGVTALPRQPIAL